MATKSTGHAAIPIRNSKRMTYIWPHPLYACLYLVFMSFIIHSGVDLWQIDLFRWTYLALAMYEMLGHVSYALTKHNVKTKSMIIDHGNRIIDMLLHGTYSILFLQKSLRDQYCYHWISVFHSWFCINHIYKYGDNGFPMKLRCQERMNIIDGCLHFASFTRIFIAEQMFNDAINNSIYLSVLCLYIVMRSNDLIW